jgi:hypothetical protein
VVKLGRSCFRGELGGAVEARVVLANEAFGPVVLTQERSVIPRQAKILHCSFRVSWREAGFAVELPQP